MVRGAVVMPNGLGKKKIVLVIASGDKQREATEDGADFVGGDEMVSKIQSEGWTAFDSVISTPDMISRPRQQSKGFRTVRVFRRGIETSTGLILSKPGAPADRLLLCDELFVTCFSIFRPGMGSGG